MLRHQALNILKTLPNPCNDPHPYAKQGTMTGFVTANDKNAGSGNVLHYYAKFHLYFVIPETKKS